MTTTIRFQGNRGGEIRGIQRHSLEFEEIQNLRKIEANHENNDIFFLEVVIQMP